MTLKRRKKESFFGTGRPCWNRKADQKKTLLVLLVFFLEHSRKKHLLPFYFFFPLCVFVCKQHYTKPKCLLSVSYFNRNNIIKASVLGNVQARKPMVITIIVATAYL